MIEKTISSNQAALILILFTVGLKFSVLPAIMCDYASNNGYIVCLIALILDFLCTVAVIVVMRKIPEKNFFDLIKETLSRPVAIIIYAILAVFFIIKCLIAILELHDYFIATLFEELNPLYFIIVLSLLMFFLFNKNLRTFGRLLEIFFWPMAIGLMFTLIYPIQDIELTNLFPIFQDGFYPIWNGIVHTSFAFGDYSILLILMGRISYKKGSVKKILLYMFSMANFIFNFYIVFVGTFGDTAINQSLALGELPLHNPFPSTIGKLEWLTIIIWTAILTIEAGILGKSASICFKHIFNKEKSYTPSIITLSIILLLYSFSYLRLETAISIATDGVVVTIASLFQLLLIILLYICYFISKKQKSKVPKGDYNVQKYKKNS